MWRGRRAISRSQADIDTGGTTNPDNRPKLVAAGKAQSRRSPTSRSFGAGPPKPALTRIGPLISTPLSTVVALADGPVKSVKDLKGREVGFSVGGLEDALLGAMLESGLKLSDVSLVNVNFSLSPALLWVRSMPWSAPTATRD